MTESNSMTKAERTELGRLMRARAKVAKNEIEAHAARVMANVEAQLAAIYPDNHPAWAEVTEHVKRVVADTNIHIAQRCRELDIPERFRPSIAYYWLGRGENLFADRRAELRKTAQKELEARVRAARNAVDRHVTDLLTQLVRGALESAQAREFLATMPSIDELMPQITLAELELIANA